MREIKFRGLSVSGEWVTGNLIHSKRFKGCSNEFRIHEPETGLESDIIPETVGQFTGLKDKNGVEVFENDVIMAAFMYHGKAGTPFKAKIIYNEHIGCYQISYLNINNYFVSDEIYFKYQIEAIGNIYDINF